MTTGDDPFLVGLYRIVGSFEASFMMLTFKF